MNSYKISLFISLLLISFSCSNNTAPVIEEDTVKNKTKADSMVKTVNDSICTYNEIVSDLKKHYLELANSISNNNYEFQTITEVFKYHIRDTNLTFKSEDILLLRFDDYNGLEVYIKGLKKLKQISFDSLKADSIKLVGFYPGVLSVQDDIINEDPSK